MPKTKKVALPSYSDKKEAWLNDEFENGKSEKKNLEIRS